MSGLVSDSRQTLTDNTEFRRVKVALDELTLKVQTSYDKFVAREREKSQSGSGTKITMSQYGNNNTQIGQISGGFLNINHGVIGSQKISNIGTVNGNVSFGDDSMPESPHEAIARYLTDAENSIKSSDYNVAISEIEEAIKLADTLSVDDELAKKLETRLAKIYKKIGDFETAARLFEETASF